MSAMKDPLEVSFDPKSESAGRAKGNIAASAQPPRTTAVTARLHGFDGEGRALVTLPDRPGGRVVARSTIPLSRTQAGAAVVVVFEHGDARRPIILGVLREPLTRGAAASVARQVAVEVDDDAVLLSAERQITLRCGDASVTLTRAGKVIIKGAYVVSRSTGHNKIKGAVVEIN